MEGNLSGTRVDLVVVDDLSLEEKIETPHWAIAKVNYGFPEGAQLATKDGRRTGNGYLARWHVREYSWMEEPVELATVVTDAGNKLELTERELAEFFHQPSWTMQPLFAHRVALEV